MIDSKVIISGIRANIYVDGKLIPLKPAEITMAYETEKEGSETDERNRRSKFDPISIK